MRKRILSLLAAVALIIGLLPSPALAVDAAQIDSQAGLAALASGSGSYVLTGDISLSDWTPITLPAGVTLDGGGHTVTLSGAPLCQKINDGAMVQNLVLKGSVRSDQSVGAVAVINNGVIRNCASYADVTYTGNGGSSWSPHYAAGLAGSASADSGRVVNSLFAGLLDAGSAPLSGGIANNQFFVNSVIESCIAVGCDRIGMTEGMSSHTQIALGSNRLIAADPFVPQDFVTHFNTNLQDGDLRWSVENGVLAPMAVQAQPDPEATGEELAALDAVIAAAEQVNTDVIYTEQSWSAFKEELKEAKEVRGTDAPKQSKVVGAAEKLTAAQASLTQRILAAADLSGQTVISVTTADQLENMQAGKYYRLDADITIGQWWFGTFNTMNSVLDGNGHTVQLNGSALWGSIGSEGVIQNLGIIGSIPGSSNDTGAIAQSCAGLIINCWSRADVTSEGMNGIRKNTGGLVANLKSGGAIVNCYVAGTVSAKGSTGTGVVGMLAAAAQGNTAIRSSYWLNPSAATGVGSAGGVMTGCAAKDREAFYSDDFLALLNSGRGTFGKIWTIDDLGWPHLGAAGNFVPPQPAELMYTPYAGFGSGHTVFTETQGLLLSLSEVLPDTGASGNPYVGRFTYPDFSGETAFVGQYTSAGQGSHKVFVSEDGDLEVLAAGSLEIAVYDKASWSGTQYETELARFTVTVSDIQAEELRLIPTGHYVTWEHGAYTVAGSGIVTLRTEVKVDGVWRSAPSSLFRFTLEGDAFDSGNTFYATRPGEMTVTAEGLGRTANVTVTSTYVPVTSIRPALSGTYIIHERNANSSGLGDFLDLMLSHGAGTVFVEPENASYRNAWTLSSDDPETAEYISSFLLAVLPYKAGTVTLTAVSDDPQLSAPVSGTSVITLEYRNPLTQVSIQEDTLTVKENETLVLPLTFAGSTDAYHITEPGMRWSFSGDGRVEIIRSPLGVIVGSENSTEYCVANSEYKMIGIQAGTVTVTGTPVDQTANAQPITFTVTVAPGEAGEPVDMQEIVAQGTEISLNRLQAVYNGTPYRFGDEWAVFTLTRAGHPLTQAQREEYLNSVTQTYTQPKNAALKPTTLARVILAVSILGENPADMEGIDFLDLLCNNRFIANSTGNESIWALIALDCRDYAVPQGAKWDRDALIAEILSYQCADGGFSLGKGQTAEVDITAMAIQSLARYYKDNTKIRDALDNALDYLRGQMRWDCDLGSSESVSQVIIALTALGLDPLDFAAGSTRNLLTALDAYRLEQDGYRHLITDRQVNNMATLQALQAWTACQRFADGLTSLYDLDQTAGEVPDTGGDRPVVVPGTGDSSLLLPAAVNMLAAVLGCLLLTVRKRKNG